MLKYRVTMYSGQQYLAHCRLRMFVQSILIFCEHQTIKVLPRSYIFMNAFKTFNIINLALFPINSSFHLLATSALDRTRGAFTELTHMMLIVSDAIPLLFSK